MSKRVIRVVAISALGVSTAGCGAASDIAEVVDAVQSASGWCGDLFNFLVMSEGVFQGSTIDMIEGQYTTTLGSIPDDVRPQLEKLGDGLVRAAAAITAAGGDVEAAAQDPETLALFESIVDGELFTARADLYAKYEAECYVPGDS